MILTTNYQYCNRQIGKSLKIHNYPIIINRAQNLFTNPVKLLLGIQNYYLQSPQLSPYRFDYGNLCYDFPNLIS